LINGHGWGNFSLRDMKETRSIVQRASRFRDFFALERNIIVLASSTFLLGCGENLWAKFLPKYLQALGASIGLVGLFGTLQEFTDTIYQYPGGRITDRIGRKNALVLFTGIGFLGYFIYLIASNWPVIFVGLLFAMGLSLAQPAIFALIGDSLPRGKRAMGFTIQSILKRLPIVIAPPIGGLLLGSYGIKGGIRLGLSASLALTLLAVFLQKRCYTETFVPVKKNSKGSSSLSRWRALNPSLKALLSADCLVRFGDRLMKIFVIFWAMDSIGATAFQFGLLTGLQMAVSILSYIPIARLADRGSRLPFVALSFFFLPMFPLVLFFAKSFTWLIFAFLVAGLREIGEPPRKALIVDLAPNEIRGEVVGIYYALRGFVVMPAAAIGGIIWSFQPQVAFLTSIVIGLSGFLLLLTRVKEPGKPVLVRRIFKGTIGRR